MDSESVVKVSVDVESEDSESVVMVSVDLELEVML